MTMWYRASQPEHQRTERWNIQYQIQTVNTLDLILREGLGLQLVMGSLRTGRADQLLRHRGRNPSASGCELPSNSFMLHNQ